MISISLKKTQRFAFAVRFNTIVCAKSTRERRFTHANCSTLSCARSGGWFVSGGAVGAMHGAAAGMASQLVAGFVQCL